MKEEFDVFEQLSMLTAQDVRDCMIGVGAIVVAMVSLFIFY